MKAYSDRYHAGKILAESLVDYKNSNAVILAIPRGGVPVAYEVAHSLALPLEIVIIKKLEIPGMREFTLGSIAQENCMTLNEAVIKRLGIRKSALDHIIYTENQELLRRESIYHENKPAINLDNKVLIIIDDGIGSGCTMQTAIKYLKNKSPAKIIIAAPIAKKSSYVALKSLPYDVICPQLSDFDTAEQWYQDSTISESEVLELLAKF